MKTAGNEVLKENITAAKLVADLFSSSFGPAGMAKLLFEGNGDFKVTRDALIMSSEVALVHPIGKLLMEAGATCRTEVGDGFISTVILAASLVERGWRLANNGIHPSVTAT
ncbi:MAG: TCP-1/cpn60 chaperonin family protein [Candidatus Caldarchaeum sp.]